MNVGRPSRVETQDGSTAGTRRGSACGAALRDEDGLARGDAQALSRQRPRRAHLPRPLDEPWIDLIADRLQLLGQPLRIRIMDHLECHGETTVQALADELDVGQQNVSRHLGLLHASGVVSRRREGRLVWYRLSDVTAAALLDDVGNQILDRTRQLD